MLRPAAHTNWTMRPTYQFEFETPALDQGDPLKGVYFSAD